MDMDSFVMKHFSDEGSVTANRVRSVISNKNLGDLSTRFASMFAANMLSIAEQSLRDAYPLQIVSYHELKDAKESVMDDVAEFCQIKQGAEGSDVSVKDSRDSQRNSTLSRQRLKNFQKELTKEEVRKIDEVLSECELPVSEAFPTGAAGLAKVLLEVGTCKKEM